MIAHENALTFVATSALGVGATVVPDNSHDLSSFDVGFFMDKAQVTGAFQERVSALGRALTADYRPASAGVAGVTFSEASQAIYATVGVSVTQQGGDNPCEYEINISQSVSVQIRPVRVGASPTHFQMQPIVTGWSDLYWSFRWRQDLSPCQLIAPGPIVNGLGHLFTNFSNNLAGTTVPGIDINPAGLMYLAIHVRDDGLLLLGRLLHC